MTNEELRWNGTFCFWQWRRERRASVRWLTIIYSSLATADFPFFFFLSVSSAIRSFFLSFVLLKNWMVLRDWVIVSVRWQAVDVPKGLRSWWCNNNSNSNNSSSSSSSCGVEAEAVAGQVQLSIVSRFRRMTVRMMDRSAVIIENSTTVVAVTHGRTSGRLLPLRWRQLLDSNKRRLPISPGRHPSKQQLSVPPCARRPHLPIVPPTARPPPTVTFRINS